MRRIVALVACLGLLVAACGASDEASTTTTSTSSTSSSTTSSTTSTIPVTTTTAPATTTTTTPGATPVKIYLLVDQPDGGPFVASVTRAVEGSDAVRAAVEALLAGPTEQETGGTPSLTTAIPAPTRLNSVAVAEGQATIDLSADYASGGGSAGMFARLAQVVFTLTQFPGVDRVAFLLDGVPVETFSSEGIEIGPSVDRTYFYDTGVVPTVFIDDPAWFAVSPSPIDVTGMAQVFEAVVNWELYDNDGAMLDEGFTMTAEGAPAWGSFVFSIPYTVDREQVGTLMMFEISARDGSRINLSEHPILLEP